MNGSTWTRPFQKLVSIADRFAVNPRLKRLIPILLLVGTELAWCAYMTVRRRIPIGHDGFQYFYLKYYFFNDFVRNGELAQWMPYLTHGSPSAWWYAVQGGIFDPVMLLMARLFQFRQFLPIFFGLLFLEKLLFLFGTWLFASEHFESRPAIFAASAAITATSIWYTQPWWNFHALIAMPLMLFLLHRSIVDFRWRWLIGLSLLLFLQTLGHLSYYLPITLLVLFVYACLILARSEARKALRTKFRWSFAGFAICCVVGASLGAELLWLQKSSADIQFIGSARQPDGGVPLVTFLTYAGYTDLRGWNQFFTGLTPHLDFTLFAGFLIASLTVLTIGSGKLTPAQRLFAVLVFGALLVSTASPVATVIYYIWPMARYFRHLALLSPLAKMFFIFLGCATLDRLISSPYPSFQWGRAVMLTLVTAIWAGILLMFAMQREKLLSFLAALVPGDLSVHPAYDVQPSRLLIGAAILLFAWVVLTMLLAAGRFGRNARTAIGWIVALLVLVEVSIYARFEMKLRTQSIPKADAEVFRFTDLPYKNQRAETPEAYGNVRLGMFVGSLGAVVGERYWAQNLLWMVDTYSTTNRTVFWSTAVDSLLQARSGNNVAKFIGPGSVLTLPTTDALLASISGFSEPKIRFWPSAAVCPDVPATASLMNDSTYRGVVPLLTASTSDSLPSSFACDAAALPSAVSEIAEASARSVHFTSNSADFEVENPSGTPLIMTYSDSWSERWRVQVNGQPVSLFRADLAYKAVVVPPGKSQVTFEYEDRTEKAVFALETAASAGFVVFLGWLIRWRKPQSSDVRAGQDPPGSSFSTI